MYPPCDAVQPNMPVKSSEFERVIGVQPGGRAGLSADRIRGEGVGRNRGDGGQRGVGEDRGVGRLDVEVPGVAERSGYRRGGGRDGERSGGGLHGRRQRADRRSAAVDGIGRSIGVGAHERGDDAARHAGELKSPVGKLHDSCADILSAREASSGDESHGGRRRRSESETVEARARSGVAAEDHFFFGDHQRVELGDLRLAADIVETLSGELRLKGSRDVLAERGEGCGVVALRHRHEAVAVAFTRYPDTGRFPRLRCRRRQRRELSSSPQDRVRQWAI